MTMSHTYHTHSGTGGLWQVRLAWLAWLAWLARLTRRARYVRQALRNDDSRMVTPIGNMGPAEADAKPGRGLWVIGRELTVNYNAQARGTG